MRRFALTALMLTDLAISNPASASCFNDEVVSIAPAMGAIQSAWRDGAVSQTTLEVEGCAPFVVRSQIVGIDATQHGERARMFLFVEQGDQVARVAVQIARGGNELAPYIGAAKGKLTWIFSRPDRPARAPRIKVDA